MNLADLTPAGRALKVLDFLWDHWLVILLGAALAYSVIAGLGKDTRIASLEGQVATLEAEKTALTTEKAAAVAGRQAAEKVAAERLTIIENERREARRLEEEGRKAVLAAEQARIDAERTLGEFVDRYAEEVRKPDCAAALDRLEASCSALSDY
jgi:outer membrane murein-binding lipoprotein Lpp